MLFIGRKNDSTSYYQKLFLQQKAAKKQGAIVGTVYNDSTSSLSKRQQNVVVMR